MTLGEVLEIINVNAENSLPFDELMRQETPKVLVRKKDEDRNTFVEAYADSAVFRPWLGSEVYRVILPNMMNSLRLTIIELEAWGRSLP